MPIKATARFYDPGELPVEITLTGPLKDFEYVRQLLSEHGENWRVHNILMSIYDVSHKLRSRVQGEPPLPRAMVPGDL